MRGIITISGSACHGKDLTANILKNKMEAMNYKILIIHQADYLKYIAQQYFGWDGKKNTEGRTILQKIGTDIVRSRDPNFWTNLVFQFIRVFQEDFDYFLIPDTRFKNEIESFGEYVTPIKVIRTNFDNGLTEEQKNHPSERALDNFCFSYYIQNKTDINGLEIEIDKFLQWYLKDSLGG
jgi:hypothetical protein